MKWAFIRAKRYFWDDVTREDAAGQAVNDAVDAWISGQSYDEELAKRTIQSSLRKASRNRNLESTELEDEEQEEYYGCHGYKII